MSLCMVWLSASVGGAVGQAQVVSELPALSAAEVSSERPAFAAEVRRWESVLQVHVATKAGDPIGKVELAALDAGGAVLDRVRTQGSAAVGTYRLLVRTRSQEGLQTVIRAVRRVRGVVAVNVAQLPETASYPGSPDFISSYTGEYGSSQGGPRVVAHHDVPEVLDKRDLLESTPIPGATLGAGAVGGGFTLNLSEMVKRMRANSWRKREERMKSAFLPILPPSGS